MACTVFIVCQFYYVPGYASLAPSQLNDEASYPSHLTVLSLLPPLELPPTAFTYATSPLYQKPKESPSEQPQKIIISKKSQKEKKRKVEDNKEEQKEQPQEANNLQAIMDKPFDSFSKRQCLHPTPLPQEIPASQIAQTTPPTPNLLPFNYLSISAPLVLSAQERALEMLAITP